MNQYKNVPPINPETIIALLADAYPKTLSSTSLQIKLHTGRPRIESALLLLAAQGRIKAISTNTVSTVYLLSKDEAIKQGFNCGDPVRGGTEPIYSRPPYVPPRMSPARADADDALKVMSRRGDKFIPATRPVSMVSSVRGGA